MQYIRFVYCKKTLINTNKPEYIVNITSILETIKNYLIYSRLRVVNENLNAETNMLIYIHGFNSSQESYKASLLKSFAEKINMPDVLEVPLLSYDPAVAMDQLVQLVHKYQMHNGMRPLCFIGSSLGGYYATWLAEKFDSRVVLVNPTVKPYELFEDYLGHNRNIYTGEEYFLTMDHVNQLKKFQVKEITKPDRYLLMLQTGDEVLDYNQALEKYAAVPSIVEEGGGHEFSEFDRHLETVLAFCGINCLKAYS